MSDGFQTGLGYYYLLVALLNFALVIHYFRRHREAIGVAWAIVGGVFMIHAFGYIAHLGWVLPLWIRNFIDWLMGPVMYTTLSVIAFCAFLY